MSQQQEFSEPESQPTLFPLNPSLEEMYVWWDIPPSMIEVFARGFMQAPQQNPHPSATAEHDHFSLWWHRGYGLQNEFWKGAFAPLFRVDMGLFGNRELGMKYFIDVTTSAIEGAGQIEWLSRYSAYALVVAGCFCEEFRTWYPEQRREGLGSRLSRWAGRQQPEPTEEADAPARTMPPISIGDPCPHCGKATIPHFSA